VQTFDNGTQIIYNSRLYRRGVGAQRVSLRAEPSEVDNLPTWSEKIFHKLMYLKSGRKRVWIGIRAASVSYWVSVNFFIGGVLFTVGSIDWMIANVGDTTHGASMSRYADTVAWPYFVGGLFFNIGCYLAVVEIINGNLQLDAAKLAERTNIECEPSERSAREPRVAQDVPLWHAKLDELETASVDCTGCGACMTGLTWWAWQPNSTVYLGTLIQLIGALFFTVGCVIGLPVVLEPLTNGYAEDMDWVEYTFVFGASVIGGICFTIASYIGSIEVTHSYNPFACPETGYSHGYVVAFCNLWGSVLFTLAAIFYFPEAELMNAHKHPKESDQLAGWWMKQMLVRLPYAVGSAMFAIGAMFGMHEVLNGESRE